MNMALILDFGGVVTRTMFETHDLSERALGLEQGTLDWRGPFDPEGDPLWQQMQAGQISERDYWNERTREVGVLAGHDWTNMSDFVRAARGADPAAIIRPEFHQTIDLVQAAGIRLAILSNELDLFYGAEFRAKLPFLSRFDVIHDATYTNILKPDPRAYAGCLEALGLQPENCVFVDDQPKNIAGAMSAGLRCVHFDVKHPGASYDEALGLLGISREETR